MPSLPVPKLHNRRRRNQQRVYRWLQSIARNLRCHKAMLAHRDSILKKVPTKAKLEASGLLNHRLVGPWHYVGIKKLSKSDRLSFFWDVVFVCRTTPEKEAKELKVAKYTNMADFFELASRVALP